MKHFFRMILAICALLLTRTAVAEEEDTFEIAMSSFSNGAPGWIDDLESLYRNAEQGRPEAQNLLGRLYTFGDSGVPVDRKEAARWFRMAADRGHAEAQFHLGCCCEYGEGVKKDSGKAVSWYRKAADQGCVPAQSRLASCLQQGKGAQQNHYEAFKWFCKAADQGDADAQIGLASCYEKGLGVEKDENLARKWLYTAIRQGSEKAQERLHLLDDGPNLICYHHPSLKITCACCKTEKEPFYDAVDYKGRSLYLCSDCKALPRCRFCMIPASIIDGNDRLCVLCSQDVVKERSEAEEILREVRESLREQFKMTTNHKIVCEIGSRYELDLRLEDDPQKMSRFESETTDGAPRYTIRILTNLPRDIFRIAVAQALAQDWLEENAPQAMDDADLREGFSLYIARSLKSIEPMRRTNRILKRLSEDGRFVRAAKMLGNKKTAADWKRYFKSEFKEYSGKMPAKEKDAPGSAQKRADAVKEAMNEAPVKPSGNRLVGGGGGLPGKPDLPPSPSNREDDLSNSQTLIRNGLRRENQKEQPPPPATRENDLSNTQKVLQNGLRRNR